MATAVILVIGGAGATGKSSLSRVLARRLGVAVLDQDVVTNPLMGRLAEAHDIPLDFGHPLLTGATRDARYRCLTDTAALNASVGVGSILVAPFTAEVSSEVAWGAFTASVAPGVPVLIWLHLDAERLAARRSRRNLPRDRGTQPEPVMPAHGIPAVVLDADLPLDRAIPPILRAVAAAKRRGTPAPASEADPALCAPCAPSPARLAEVE
jgi:predicted kinase